MKGWPRFKYQLQYRISNLILYLYGNFYFLLLVNFCTFYALFGDYLRIMLFRKPVDPLFDGIVIFCFIIFVIEIVIYWIADKTYFMGFYFFLDLISTVFLIFDITSISNKVFYSSPNLSISSIIAIEFSKIFRHIRLIRVLKLFKKDDLDKGKKNMSKKIANSYTSKEKKESKVTKRLKANNIKRLLCLILLMLITVPMFNVELYLNQDQYKVEDHFAFIIPKLSSNLSQTQILEDIEN